MRRNWANISKSLQPIPTNHEIWNIFKESREKGRQKEREKERRVKFEVERAVPHKWKKGHNQWKAAILSYFATNQWNEQYVFSLSLLSPSFSHSPMKHDIIKLNSTNWNSKKTSKFLMKEFGNLKNISRIFQKLTLFPSFRTDFTKNTEGWNLSPIQKWVAVKKHKTSLIHGYLRYWKF